MAGTFIIGHQMLAQAPVQQQAAAPKKAPSGPAPQIVQAFDHENNWWPNRALRRATCSAIVVRQGRDRDQRVLAATAQRSLLLKDKIVYWVRDLHHLPPDNAKIRSLRRARYSRSRRSDGSPSLPAK